MSESSNIDTLTWYPETYEHMTDTKRIRVGFIYLQGFKTD